MANAVANPSLIGIYPDPGYLPLKATEYFPELSICFPYFTAPPANATCPEVTQSMINFLNITTGLQYRQNYCLNPPSDSCSFGYCSNPDIAGIPVRVATYVTNVCLAIIVFYAPSEMNEAFYSQVLSVYSFVVAAIVAISQNTLTRLHAVFAMFAAASPLTIYLVLYAIRSCFHFEHRLTATFGTGKILNRLMVLAAAPLWIAVLVYVALPSKLYRFSQAACDAEVSNSVIEFFFIGPFGIFLISTMWTLIGATPITIVALTWIVCILLQRRVIWSPGSGKLPLRRIWRKVIDNYPFVQFYTVIIFPFAFWITMMEIPATLSYETLQFTFGQTLALFVAVPPLIQVLRMLPRVPRWLWDLAWVRLITFRPQRTAPRYQASGSMVMDGPEVYDLETSKLTPSHGSVSSASSYDDPFAASHKRYDSYAGSTYDEPVFDHENGGKRYGKPSTPSYGGVHNVAFPAPEIDRR